MSSTSTSTLVSSSVILSNPLATPSQLLHRQRGFSPSALPQDLQDVIFHTLLRLAFSAGLLLELPLSVSAQACVVLARYFLSLASNERASSQQQQQQQLLEDEFANVAAATLYTVAKTGGSPVGMNSVANVFKYLESREKRRRERRRTDKVADGNGKEVDDPGEYYLADTDYLNFQKTILGLEPKILSAVGYDTHVALPHSLAITYLQALDFLGLPGEKEDSTSHANSDRTKSKPDVKTIITKQELARKTIGYLNTSLLSPQLLYLTHSPPALAAAAIYSAAKDLGAKMPECAWWEVFDVEREELGFLVVGMRSLEGWVRKVVQNEDGDGIGGLEEADGMMGVTRSDVEMCLRKRGLLGEEQGGAKDGAEEEEMMMRKMDEKVYKETWGLDLSPRGNTRACAK